MNERTDRPLEIIQTCLHLRHKLMYVDVEHMRPGEVDVSSQTRNYWCQLSQESRGPDREPAEPFSCSASRACYRGVGRAQLP